MEALAASNWRCLHHVQPIVLDATGVSLPAECHIPDTCFVAGDERVLKLMSHNTLVVGDSISRQFFLECVHLNRRGRAGSPVLEFGGHHDWAYVSNRSVDRLLKLRKQEPVPQAAQGFEAAQTPLSMALSFQQCTSLINFSKAVYEHGFWPGRIVLFAPVYWHAVLACGDRVWSIEKWGWDLLTRANGTLPPDFRGLVHLVIPPMGNALDARDGRKAQAFTRVLEEIVRPRWNIGDVYRMSEGATTWSQSKHKYENWHTVCSPAFARNGSLHFYGTQDGQCAALPNSNLLTDLTVK